jgi:PTH1 family peptidyl-tRNA hydrolase
VNPSSSPFYLLVGLGNPGVAYESTRHNVGFRILEKFASLQGLVFKDVPRLQARLAQGVIDGRKVLVLLPQTYMNSSGQSVRLCVDYFNIDVRNIMVISDEIALELGRIKLKPGGSCGGHNGLRSIEAHLGTQLYPRMRVGVGSPGKHNLADYVLSPFALEESKALEPVAEAVVLCIQLWIKEGIVKAMQNANGRQELKPEQNVGETPDGKERK